MLHIRGVTVWDTGTYTCEIEADMENHITLSHFLQVLGKNQDWHTIFQVEKARDLCNKKHFYHFKKLFLLNYLQNKLFRKLVNILKLVMQSTTHSLYIFPSAEKTNK